MQATSKNHYNPCFWTAHWNPEYLNLAVRGQRGKLDARSRRVFVLNVKSGKVYQQAVENVHYDKNFGLAEITREDAKGFCQRNFPEKYDQFSGAMDALGEAVYYLDFENILTRLEQTEAYRALLEVIRKGRIDTLREKGDLATFVLIQHIRGHAIMNSLVEMGAVLGRPKFEEFWLLEHALADTGHMFRQVVALTSGRWRLYRLDKDTFPLNDTPVLIQPRSVMVALSPRLLLEIDRSDFRCENGWESVNHIALEKLEEFRRRTIGNTFREIIFGDRARLEEWGRTPEFQQRHELMADTRTYNQMVGEYLGGQVWKVNAHGDAVT